MDSINKQRKSNKIFETIRNFETLFPEEFQKCDIHKCGHCKGTGLKNTHTIEHCSYCGGMGYRGFEKIDGEFVCRTCNGYGCVHCNNGIVDWVNHARGTDIVKGKYIK
jgi:DnaJ-class molecular chaperone